MIKIEGVRDFGRVGHYERKGIYAPEEVFSHLGAKEAVDFDGDTIRMGSPRYILFNTNLICVVCDLVGIFFAKERAIYLDRPSGRYCPTTNHYHFNLYGLNDRGDEVMLTKDHIHPKSQGGSEDQSNFQTMCARCNGRKRDRIPGETDEQYAERRRKAVLAEIQRNRDLKSA